MPRLTANGALLRVNYQVDGSNNTQKDRAGLRQMPMSEVMIREVKVVTSGYAPEFGQTMGLVYNAITPSGTNTLQGPGQLPHAAPVDGGAAVLHGRRAPPSRRPTSTSTPSISAVRSCRDKTHFFGGYEHTERDLSGLSVITISPANQALLGLTEPPTCRAASTPSSRSARSITRSAPATACRCATCSSTTSSPRTSAAASSRCSAPTTSPIASTRPARS